MLIKCPQCATSYNIPDKALSDRPRKMRCAKCTTVFVVTRKSENPPSGYMEYTGAQKLPPEFAFLRERAKETTPPKPMPLVEKDEDTDVGPAPAPPAGRRPVQDAPPPVEPVQPAQPAAPAAPVADQPEPSTVASQPSMVVASEKQMEVPGGAIRGGGIPVGNSLPAETLFGSRASSAWEVEAPLELGNFAVTDEMPQGSQAAGKVAFIVGLLVVGFFLFVAMRNGWSLSLMELPGQVALAFSTAPTEHLPEAVKSIDVTVVNKKVVLNDSDKSFLVVEGEVFNNDAVARSKVIIRGRLIDGANDIRAEVRYPCGRVVDEAVIAKTAAADMEGHFRPDGQLANCTISPNDANVFQIIFTDLPADYNAGFDVKVRAVAANVGR